MAKSTTLIDATAGDNKAVAANNLPRTRPATYADIYSNFVTANLTPHDMTLTFGRIKHVGPGVIVNEEQCSITLPPIQFKLLADLCARVAGAYELAYVPIELTAADKGHKASAKEIADRILAASQEALGATAASSSSTAPALLEKQSGDARKKRAMKPALSRPSDRPSDPAPRRRRFLDV